MAAKLVSALHGHSLGLLQFAEEVFDEVPPFLDLAVDTQRGRSVRFLQNDDLDAALSQIGDDPVRVEALSAISPPYSMPLMSSSTPMAS